MAEKPDVRVWVTEGACQHLMRGCVLLRHGLAPKVEAINPAAAQAIYDAAKASLVWCDMPEEVAGMGEPVSFLGDSNGTVNDAIVLARHYLAATQSNLVPQQLAAMKAGLPVLAYVLVRVGELTGRAVESLTLAGLPVPGSKKEKVKSEKEGA